MIESEERAQRQRDFYLKLSPQGGQVIAENLGGFTPPGPDSQESELRDNVALWLKIQNSGAFNVISDTAWWMTHFADRHGRLTRWEAHTKADELSSYAIATIGQLIDQGILKFNKEPEIPKLVTSTYDAVRTPVEQAVLDRMEAAMKKEHTNE